ncbi:uncharacterized protein LOC127791497 [Diospyros lotus]|uniref:uncharacterized protein LOC127791497 n=1 Tax=Diospyros lotus TaxID=55363 RepID=UPI0022567FC4|nr:uncharacterized protein LOC127791497 [Diospyros lotus]
MASLLGVGSTIPHCYSPNSVPKHSPNKALPLLLLLRLPSSDFLSSYPVWSTRVLTLDYERISERRARRRPVVRAAGESMSTITEKLGVKVHRNPPESKLTELGVRNWPKWGCPPSKFPWTYSSKEVCYLLKGKVKVYPDGSKEAVEIGAGDLVEFPKGLSCTWHVSEAVDKHYYFE